MPEGPRTDEPADRQPSPPRPVLVPTVRELDPALEDAWRDDFEREELGDAWRSLSDAWRVVDGQLCGRGARNRGVWLRRRLPETVSVTFDARSDAAAGDIKVEVFGDGHTGANKNTYDDATSYLLIFGGWNNEMHVLARLDEHGAGRLVAHAATEGTSVRTQKVQPHRAYRFRIERAADKTLRWWVDDELIHELADDDPLAGPGHDHFGFNDWNAPVCFDNLEVRPL